MSTMSRILSECVMNMPNVVLYYTTLLKAISLRMEEIFKPDYKSVYQLNLQKKYWCYINESGETNYRYRLLLTTETTR